MKRFVKQGDLHAFEWYMATRPECRPSDVVLSGTELSYAFVEGTCPVPASCAGLVLETASRYLWGGWAEAPGPPVCIEYAQYCCERLSSVMPLSPEVQALYDALTQYVRPENLTGAKRVHGDMTLENCVLVRDGNGIVFIDPGHDRGLVCQELDASKLLQSLDGWKADRVQPPPAWVRPVHWALLASHYARILAHSELHSRYWLDFALHRMTKICEGLRHTSST